MRTTNEITDHDFVGVAGRVKVLRKGRGCATARWLFLRAREEAGLGAAGSARPKLGSEQQRGDACRIVFLPHRSNSNEGKDLMLLECLLYFVEY